MLQSRRRKQRAKKDLAVAAKRTKKLREKNVTVGSTDTPDTPKERLA
jgi:hypothetical protein